MLQEDTRACNETTRAAHINVHVIEEWLEYKEHSATEEDDHHQCGTGVLPDHIPKVDLPLRHFSSLVHPDVAEIPEEGV